MMFIFLLLLFVATRAVCNSDGVCTESAAERRDDNKRVVVDDDNDNSAPPRSLSCAELRKLHGSHFGGRPAHFAPHSSAYRALEAELHAEVCVVNCCCEFSVEALYDSWRFTRALMLTSSFFVATLGFFVCARGAQLLRLQHPSDCRTARILLYSPHECGLGAELHWINVAMTVALVTNRTLVMREDKPWIYAQEPYCAAGMGTFSCYFMPFSSCVARTSAELATLRGADANADCDATTQTPVPVIKTQALDVFSDVRVVQYTENLQEQLDFKFTRDVPAAWDVRLRAVSDGSHPLFWYL